MVWALAADLTLAAHLGFVLFVAAGGLLVARYPRLAWAHLPCVAWGAYVAFSGAVCPLTPLENHFSALAGRVGYAGGFLEHYLTRALYPEGLTRTAQAALGALAIGLNVAAYAWLWRRSRARRQDRAPGAPRC